MIHNQRFYHNVTPPLFPPKTSDDNGLANSGDTDQTAPGHRSALVANACLSENFALLGYCILSSSIIFT